MPALPSCIVEPLWDQVAALLPPRPDTHPLGCYRPRIPDRLVFDKLVQVLVFGCGYRRIADHTCSATTLRRRRDDWTPWVRSARCPPSQSYTRTPATTTSRVGQVLTKHGMVGQIATRGMPAPIQVGRWWVIERTHAWANQYGKLRWCTERRQLVVVFWLALAGAVIVLGRLVRRAWVSYRWEGRPRRRL